jgi:TonB family protein
MEQIAKTEIAESSMSRYNIISVLIHVGLLLLFISPGTKKATEIIELSLLNPAPSASGPVSAKKPITSKVAVPASGQNENAGRSQAQNSGSANGGPLSKMPEVLKEHQIEYPRQAKRAGVEGDVILSVLISETGAVENLSVLKGAGYDLDEAAMEAVKKFIFSPGYKEGLPARVQINYTYRFRLE